MEIPLSFVGPGDLKSLDKFLKDHPPSKTSSSEGPWIWVRKHATNQARTDLEEAIAISKGKAILEEVTQKIHEIETDDAIPVRSSKARPINKKLARENTFKAAKAQLHQIANEYNYTYGKWLLFLGPQYVDTVFAKIARSLIAGPLKSSPADTVKVSTSEGLPTQRVLCLYMPDIYDRSAVEQVLGLLIKNHGVEPMSAKPDLYTAIGLDSTHPSRMPPVVFHPKDFYTKEDIARLKNSRAVFTQSAQSSPVKRKADDISTDTNQTPCGQMKNASMMSRSAVPTTQNRNIESDSTDDDFVPLAKPNQKQNSNGPQAGVTDRRVQSVVKSKTNPPKSTDILPNQTDSSIRGNNTGGPNPSPVARRLQDLTTDSDSDDDLMPYPKRIIPLDSKSGRVPTPPNSRSPNALSTTASDTEDEEL